MNAEIGAIIGLGFVLGLRHAIDWDHIAAITDFIGAEDTKKKSFFLSLYYVMGHALVNLVFGSAAILLGNVLPEWVDGVIERIVGIILIGLGIWLIVALFNRKDEQVLLSRWTLLFMGIRKISYWLKSKFKPVSTPVQQDFSVDLGARSACCIGILHGIGGETGTQILLFTAAAGAGTVALGLTAVLAFIIGLFIAQTVLILLLLNGYAQAAKNPKVYVILASTTALYSIAVGIIFLIGQSDLLPTLTLT
ncbi:hypothetical protein [Pelosinus sp. UFO1]|uniref:HoxN/HupN/NixA family nickel/cobalt transporter n=1 Tax=Pelosinus sp. UFO1 TaxID=484770 RepID=UPI0004D10293|nr:hypothetical protein [Pelosinus sp. UFO1]AIF53322.1 high-affinity nickel-transporter [Pelosinus sp. UFO1]